MDSNIWIAGVACDLRSLRSSAAGHWLVPLHAFDLLQLCASFAYSGSLIIRDDAGQRFVLIYYLHAVLQVLSIIPLLLHSVRFDALQLHGLIVGSHVQFVDVKIHVGLPWLRRVDVFVDIELARRLNGRNLYQGPLPLAKATIIDLLSSPYQLIDAVLLDRHLFDRNLRFEVEWVPLILC